MAHIERSFHVSADPADRLPGLGWEVETTGGETTARQGSQLRTRLMGGWFTKPAHLPKRLTVTPADGGYDVALEDTLGFGLFDPKLRRRYAAAFDEVESELS